jgi:3-phosphoshikimate 1-carboxyvinyltransferase
MLRAVAAAVLTEAGKPVTVVNPSDCADAEAALGIAEAFGAEVRRGSGLVVIEPGLHPPVKNLFCGESGLCLRMFAAVAALRAEEFSLDGRGSLERRPVSMMEGPLRDLGARCETRNGFAPVIVQGPLRGGRTVVDGSLSSQFLTGLLLTLPRAPGDSELIVSDLKSRAYIDVTLDFLSRAAVEVEGEAPGILRVRGGQAYKSGTYTVEGDWSGAAFLLVAGALAGEVRVLGLDPASLQADRAILQALERCGAEVSVTGPEIMARRRDLRAFDMDLAGSPDLFPPLVALACFCRGTTRLAGAGRLRHKESDRASALMIEFGRLGAEVLLEGDTMAIRGGALEGGVADPHGDHRVAMALAVAALRAEKEVVIEDAGCVDKSYPRFFEDLGAVGGRIHE